MRKHTQSPAQAREGLPNQPCIRAVLGLPTKLRDAGLRFIRRNKVTEQGHVSPHCLKAHLITKAYEFHVSERQIRQLKTLFKSRVGYQGYYLDAGKLRKVPVRV